MFAGSEDIVCLTEYAGELLGERDRRRRWRRIVENWHVDQAAALREQEAARIALEKEHARQARRDRSAQWKRMRDDRAAKKARLAGRSMAAA